MHAKALMATLVLLVGCGSEHTTGDGGADTGGADTGGADTGGADHSSAVSSIGGEAGEAIKAMLAKNDGLEKFFHGAHGFAIFPNVGKGGLIIGGGGGGGFVYEEGEEIGTSKMSFVSIGAQAGGQSLIEVIFFKDKAALDNFRRGNFEFGAQVSAVAVDSGAALDAGYDKGVAVFTMSKKGLMAEASVSGQKFTFKAK